MKFKKITTLLLAVMLLISTASQAFATENESSTTATDDEIATTEENYGLIEDPYDRLETGFDDTTLSLASSYDPRDYGYATKTKSQGSYQLCWMYSTIGAAEQYISLNYGSHFDISEAHGAVALSNSIMPSYSDGTVYFTEKANKGGSPNDALSYLSNWNAPIFKDNPITWNSLVLQEDYSKDELSLIYSVPVNDNFLDAKSIFNLTSTKYIDNSPATIKYAIKNYGGVITGIFMDKWSIKTDGEGQYSYYYGNPTNDENDIKANHSVVIVGWDDDYSKENFTGNNKPTNNGAWLIRNSWYNTDTENYIWVSYEEDSIYLNTTKRYVITGMQEATDSEYMLSYDYRIPAYNKDFSFNDTVYLCNVFDISTYIDEENKIKMTDVYDRINKVMLYLKATECTYKIKILQLDDDNNIPNNLDNYNALAQGDFNGEGYITVDLENDYIFNSENKCAVIVELSPINSNSIIYVPNTPISNKIMDYGESFVGMSSDENEIEWSDCKYIQTKTQNGYLSIRPILLNSSTDTIHYANISPSQIIDNDEDINIDFDTDCKFLCIRTKTNNILRQYYDYTKTENGIIIKKEYIDSLNDKYTELTFEFSNRITKTVIVNPKATISDISVSGNPIVGETLTASVSGYPEKDTYDVTYQWQHSSDGVVWEDIANATSDTYVVTKNYIDRYIRVSVSSKKYGNVTYPLTDYSASTDCKVVLLGDVDLDKSLSIKDSTLISKYAVSLENDFNTEQLLAADANKDGRINVSDATKVQKIIVGLE